MVGSRNCVRLHASFASSTAHVPSRSSSTGIVEKTTLADGVSHYLGQPPAFSYSVKASYVPSKACLHIRQANHRDNVVRMYGQTGLPGQQCFVGTIVTRQVISQKKHSVVVSWV